MSYKKKEDTTVREKNSLLFVKFCLKKFLIKKNCKKIKEFLNNSSLTILKPGFQNSKTSEKYCLFSK